MSNSSSSSTVVMSQSLSNSQDLSSSTSSSRSPSRQGSQQFSKIYKQASQLFLTRRLGEALSLLEPIISVPKVDGHIENSDEEPAKAPIASASVSQRTKIWSLYITLLNSIVDLTDDEAIQEVGQKKHNDFVSEVRSGRIWERIVQDGYGGREGSVDTEVVFNLLVVMQRVDFWQEGPQPYLSGKAGGGLTV